MLVAQLGIEPAEALVRIRAHAYATDRTATDVARDILDRRLPAGCRLMESPTVWTGRKCTMTETPRETRVLGAVVSLVDSLLVDFDVVELLTELTEHCAVLLDVEAAGLLLADPLDQLRLLAATSEQARELELFQLQADEGPCVECYTTGNPVSVADLADPRPADGRETSLPRIDGGFAAVHAVPRRYCAPQAS